MKDPRMGSRSGFSFVEVMAAMAAGLVVVAAALQSVVYFQRQFARQHAEVIRQQDLRLGLELFAQELRLAGPGSLSVIRSDVVEFMANVSGLMTNASASAAPGQTTLTVDDGRGWPDGKLVSICWNDQCESVTLARAGQRNLLTFVEPARRSIPAGALAAVTNRVRYYSRADERGVLRWLRQIDGGASVIAGNLETFTLRYWDAQGRSVVRPELVRRIQIEITLPGRAIKETREITLRA
jgi:prepilin-type N-terminal cleavage/methylation domain-containing protein